MSENLTMPTILQSIHPQGCELITSGKKKIEVRKTKPKIPTPFKVYIYCTKPKSKNDLGICIENGKIGLVYQCNYDAAERSDMQILSGKVIGEYICDDISQYGYDTIGGLYFPYMVIPCKNDDFLKTDAVMPLNDMCLNQSQLIDYGRGETLYGWHISDIKIYDKPKDLSEFYVIDNEAVKQCKHRYFAYSANLESGYACDKVRVCLEWCKKCKVKPLTRPPQSWCYVEE